MTLKERRKLRLQEMISSQSVSDCLWRDLLIISHMRKRFRIADEIIGKCRALWGLTFHKATTSVRLRFSAFSVSSRVTFSESSAEKYSAIPSSVDSSKMPSAQAEIASVAETTFTPLFLKMRLSCPESYLSRAKRSSFQTITVLNYLPELSFIIR